MKKFLKIVDIVSFVVAVFSGVETAKWTNFIKSLSDNTERLIFVISLAIAVFLFIGQFFLKEENKNYKNQIQVGGKGNTQNMS